MYIYICDMAQLYSNLHGDEMFTFTPQLTSIGIDTAKISCEIGFLSSLRAMKLLMQALMVRGGLGFMELLWLGQMAGWHCACTQQQTLCVVKPSEQCLLCSEHQCREAAILVVSAGIALLRFPGTGQLTVVATFTMFWDHCISAKHADPLNRLITWSFTSDSYYTLQRNCKGDIVVSAYPSVYLFVHASSRQSVCLWMESCPVCIFHNTFGIHLIFTHLINQLQKGFRVLSYFSIKSKIWIFVEILYLRLLDLLYDLDLYNPMYDDLDLWPHSWPWPGIVCTVMCLFEVPGAKTLWRVLLFCAILCAMGTLIEYYSHEYIEYYSHMIA